MGFKETESGVLVKSYHNLQTFQMKADFNTERLEYAQGITADRDTTKDFHQPENFVVFICVSQLLQRGYAPKNIVLEASAGADGRGQTNTYLDILVKDNDGSNYLIIECKTTDGTSDDEFAKAWKKVEHDGGQLFNYFTLFRTRHLCLYACDFVNGCVKPRSNIIILKDENPQYLDDTHKEGYRDLNATAGQNDYFRVWTKTYEQAFLSSGIFEDNAKPYEISTKITRTFDELEEIDDYQAIQRKYNEFATIMRQHNVGSRENSFDKLVNLFLAKIVDEESNKDDLRFNWKGVAFDDYYSFQDRLQELYTQGMDKFLDEDVTYINEETIRNAFTLFKNDPDATRSKIIQYFREQKFYSNNDFAFLDVHNKQLFLKNIAVLIQIVQMLQDIRLKSDKENQFLGDLFEGFLDQGVKQSEGQFFTPIPIVKFLVASLPIEEIVRDSDRAPMVIDYACGAGHFLNEVARRIKACAERYHPDKALKDFYANIVGIEKEYRLSKVAKVSAFMYSQDEIQIIYGDALAQNGQINDGSFDILVANPPYSVKGFLETLTEEERARYELYSRDLNLEKNNSIETFFIERAKQLLRRGGVCAIILPSSVLSNGGIYTACREIILKYFDLVALAEFGSGTFGKTGTNTVTLFMRRKQGDVDAAEHFRNRAAAWLKGDFSKDCVFEDARLLDAYCRHCGLDVAEYRSWVQGGALPTAQIFSDYTKAAESQARYKAIAKKRISAKYTAMQQTAELAGFVADYIRQAECEKLYYYLLAADVSQPVLTMRSPTDNKAIKQFLGYEWSGAKGSEGIKYLGQNNADDEDQLSKNKGLQAIRTPLFDPADLDSPRKINTLIRRNFLGEDVTVPAELTDYVSQAMLTDMIDFKRTTFDKAINASAKSEVTFESRWPMKRLGDLCVCKGGNTFPEIYQGDTNSNHIPFYKVSDMNNVGNEIFMTNSNNYVETKLLSDTLKAFIFPKDTIIFPKVGMTIHTNKKRILSRPAAVDNNTMGVMCGDNINPYFFYNYCVIYINLSDIASTANPPSINAKGLENILLPIPPLSIQQQIVSECEEIDSEVSAARNSISVAQTNIERLMADVSGESKPLKDIAPLRTERMAYSEINPETYVSTDNLLQDCQGKTAYNGVPNITSVIAYKRGDILLSNIRPYLRKLWLADSDGGCNPDVLVLRPSEEVLSQYLYNALRRQPFFDHIMTDVKGMKMPRGKKEVIERYSVPVPPLEVQREMVARISEHEREIAAAKQVIAAAPAKKQAILDKYLK